MRYLINHTFLFLFFVFGFAPTHAELQCRSLFNKYESTQASYQTSLAVTYEKVKANDFQVIRFPSLNFVKKYFSFDVPLKKIYQMSFGEIFMKFIRPSVLNDYLIFRYKLADFISPEKSEIIVGFDRNHTYLLVYDAATGKYTRADSGSDVEFTVMKDVKSVTSGLFLRFSKASPEAIQAVLKAVNTKRKYMTCSQGVCQALSAAGIHIGDRNVETTYELIEHLINQKIRITDPNVEFDVFSLDPRPIEDQFNESTLLSRVNQQIREKTPAGYVIVAKGLGTTIKYWLFYKMGLMSTDGD